ncbi:hypothetical protein Xvie_01888 [Xenorhabdus vietnamensis]|uniref:Uncharacterized protein n=1 Tax=Xenorhabdus vietnamensis TaxID=351656 RepID=A0A1Y2SDT0_9GAMM|nr:hypothetical protein Xvie_01888 [Xenorhabdus vietnamensis]
MKILFALCTAIFLLTSWNTSATEIKRHNTPKQCEARARTICAKHIKHHKKYKFCLKEVYNTCIRQ